MSGTLDGFRRQPALVFVYAFYWAAYAFLYAITVS